MIVGHLEGYISVAGKIALQKGAKVIHCEDTEEALGALLNGKGADVVMCDVKQKIGPFVKALEEQRIYVPVVACGIGTPATPPSGPTAPPLPTNPSPEPHAASAQQARGNP